MLPTIRPDAACKIIQRIEGLAELFASSNMRCSRLRTHSADGLEPDVVAEAHLDPDSIFAGIQCFAKDRDERLTCQRELLGALD
jgi:hypothetical protein